MFQGEGTARNPIIIYSEFHKQHFLFVIDRIDDGGTFQEFLLPNYHLWGQTVLITEDNIGNILATDEDLFRVFHLEKGRIRIWKKDDESFGENVVYPPRQVLQLLLQGKVLEAQYDRESELQGLWANIRLVSVAEAARLLIPSMDDRLFRPYTLKALRQAWTALPFDQRIDQQAALPPWAKQIIVIKLLCFLRLRQHSVKTLLAIMHPAALSGF